MHWLLAKWPRNGEPRVLSMTSLTKNPRRMQERFFFFFLDWGVMQICVRVELVGSEC